MKPCALKEQFQPQDVEYLKEGRHFELYKKLGAHCVVFDGQEGVCFSVWAPHAAKVSVVGDFNAWDRKVCFLEECAPGSGIWEGFVPGIGADALYKFSIEARDGNVCEKIDPFGFRFEEAPKTSAVVYQSKYTWEDDLWLKNRAKCDHTQNPVSIYEVHVGSWRKKDATQKDSFLNYREFASEIIPYLKDMGFTHVELLPVSEHPFYPSWGYQSLGFYAPTSRYGTPDDFKYFIDQCHQNGIGVILDWVPSHFPFDAHGLVSFDGTALYEKDDVHPDWGSCIFNIGRHEVAAFLISNALFWCEEYHIDGLRVDAVASMLYLDFSRSPDKWTPNFLGGKENLESVAFLRRLNVEIKQRFSDVLIMAEESSAWPKVSERAKDGGLNFDMKWNMGWMHDTLEYFSSECQDRKDNHAQLTFSLGYVFTEKFLMSLSHDEVVHGKSSLLGKMGGREEEKFKNLRCLLGYMFAHPGKKLTFMGGELATWKEWHHDEELDWQLLSYDRHQGVQAWMRDLNHMYVSEKALHEQDFSAEGFQWILDNTDDGVTGFVRNGLDDKDKILIICHFHKGTKKSYRIGVPLAGNWQEILNSNNSLYEGHEAMAYKTYSTEEVGWQSQGQSFELDLEPLTIRFFKFQK